MQPSRAPSGCGALVTLAVTAPGLSGSREAGRLRRRRPYPSHAAQALCPPDAVTVRTA